MTFLSKSLIIALTCLFILSCSQPTETPSTETVTKVPAIKVPRILSAPLLKERVPQRFGAITREAQAIQPGFEYITGPGHQLLTWIGNGGSEDIHLTVNGADPAHATLKPNTWTRLDLRTYQELVSFHWEAGELMLAQPHLSDKGDDKVPSVLLISLDTLRRDYFTPEHMPQTYALFKEHGFIMDRAYTPTTWTLPSHTSLFTSLYPSHHGVRRPDLKLHKNPLTLAEHLRSIGYYCAAFTEGNYVSATFGLERGFHHYEENPPVILGGKADEISKLEGTLEAFTNELKLSSKKPRFFFLHTYEVHSPYIVHGDAEDPEQLGSTKRLLELDGKPLNPDHVAKMKELYAGEVAYTDAQIAPVLTQLLSDPNWVIVLTSDHGEEFGEHGGLLHADTVYEETAAVPLAFAGRRIQPLKDTQKLVSLVDIAPTLVGLLKLPQPDGWQGRDLTTSDEEIPVYAESFFFGVHEDAKNSLVAGVWEDQLKLMHLHHKGEDHISLYNLSQDPLEQNNLQEDQVRDRNRMYGLLRTYFQDTGAKAVDVKDLTPEQIEVMRSLGYIK